MKPPWSEVIVFWDVSSGIAPPARRRALAGEGSCASDHSSGERMFAGGHRFPGGRNPAKPQLSEVMIFLDVLLRQSNPLQEEILTAEGGCISYLSSGERMFAGGHRFPGSRTPAKPPWSEVMIFLDVLLRQSTPLQEKSPYRRRELCQRSQFRRANVRRRTSISRRPKSGEAAVVGGDDLFGCSPPAEQPLTGGNPYRRRGLCQLPQFRRANVRRRTLISRQSNFGEAAVVGSDDLFGGCPPARKPLTGGEPLSEKRVMPMTPGPVSECSPEEVALRAAVVRRSRCGRR